MRILFTLIFVLCSYILASGQGHVSGKVFDSDSCVLATAKVILLHQKDTSIAQMTYTDDDGKFVFDGVVKGSYYVKATYLSSSTALKKIIIWNQSKINIELFIDDAQQLQEVKVVSTGINVSGDTTTYIVNHFVSGSERNLKDVLNQLPNVRVDENSKSITANGKHVSRILLEGQDLFQGNTSIPMDNISANSVRKVDVIDNYSEYNIFDGFKTSNETVVNVGFDEKSRNRIKGEIEGYGGVVNKYKMRNSSIYIGSKKMLSTIVSSNNVGERLLSFQDIIQFNGGYKNLLSGESPTEELSKQLEDYSAFTNNKKDITQRNNSMAALNYINIPNDKIKISFSGVYGYDFYRSHKEIDYEYMSGFNYHESLTEKSGQHNGLMNLKMSYIPNKNFSIIYTGNMINASQDKSGNNELVYNPVSYNSLSHILSINNAVVLAQRLGKNLLSFSINQTLKNNNERYDFKSSDLSFLKGLNLDDKRDFYYENDNKAISMQLFYMYRINDAYYLRLAVNGDLEKQNLCAFDCEQYSIKDENENSELNYSSLFSDVQIGRDRGKFVYSVRLRYIHNNVCTNIKKDFNDNKSNVFSPFIQAKYQFTPFHYIMTNYKYGTNRNSIMNLFDGQWLKSYNQLYKSSANRFFSSSHKISCSHLLSLQYSGWNFLNTLSYEFINNPICNNNIQEGVLNITEKKIGAKETSLSFMSSVEYKFVDLPLNIRYNVNYNQTHSPMLNAGTLYNTTSNNVQMMLQLRTFFKKGFNCKMEWSALNMKYSGTPTENKYMTNDILALVSWQNKDIYADFNAKLKTFNLNQTKTNNVYYGFDFRYNMSKKLVLEVSGTDILHINERRQLVGNISSYYLSKSLTWHLPGHIIAGITMKY